MATKAELDQAQARIAELEAQLDPATLREMLRAEQLHTADLTAVADQLRAELGEHKDRAARAEKTAGDAHSAREAYYTARERRNTLVRDFCALRDEDILRWASEVETEGDKRHVRASAQRMWNQRIVPFLNGAAVLLRDHADILGEGTEPHARAVDGAFGVAAPTTRQEAAAALQMVVVGLRHVAVEVQASSAAWVATQG